MIEIVTIETPSLGDRGYLATDGSAAIVIDPQRDIDRVLAIAAERAVAVTHVFETHIHNDYVTGGLALAGQTGARYHLNGDDPVAFERTPVADGDLIDAGVDAGTGHRYARRDLHPPVLNALHDGDQVVAAFTGGSLLNGSTGRTDLLGAAHRAELARAQYRSAQRLARELPDAAAIRPTHGFGKLLLGHAHPQGASSTLAEEKRANPVLMMDEAEYVETLLAGLDAYPAYYAHMGPANSAGPAAPDLSSAPAGRSRGAAPPDRRRRVGRRPALTRRVRRGLPARFAAL